MLETTFIYALNDPVAGRARYVGKADDPYSRYEEHVESAYRIKTYKTCWLRSLLKADQAPVLEVLDEVPVVEWPFWEREWIRLYWALGFDLTNGTNGGEGGAMTPEIVARGAAKRRGRKLTAKHRANLSAAGKGRVVSPAAREKRRLALLGSVRPSAVVAAMRASRFVAGPKKDSSSKFKGVCWSETRKTWAAAIVVRQKQIFLGVFRVEEEAARVRDIAVKKYHPPGSYLNFPD